MNNSIPVRHHYIPQFVIRPFCNHNTGMAIYYDKNTKGFLTRNPEEIFVARNLYKDSINNPSDPMKIEKDLAVIENDTAPIIRKMVEEDDVILSFDEQDKLMVFYALMGLRAHKTAENFGTEVSDEIKASYRVFQEDGNLTDYWKRNLGLIANCNSIREILDHPRIDMPIKFIIDRDFNGIAGMYMMLVERRGTEDFILGDYYPAVVMGQSIDGLLSLPLFFFCPISPKRCILLVPCGVEGSPAGNLWFEKKFYNKPMLLRDGRRIRIHVKKIYEQEVKMINQISFDYSDEGVILQDTRSVQLYE